MPLFREQTVPENNLLPYGGLVHYYGPVMPAAQAEHYFKRLTETIAWKNDEVKIFGKRIITKRKVAWYGDAPFAYTYSNTTKNALPWTRELLELKALAEKLTKKKFNSCLLNLYHSGAEGMAWHADNEKILGEDPAIASFSFGVARKFSLKNKQTKEVISVLLDAGSLLLMHGQTQSNWLHRLPPAKKITEPRINLTFRKIIA